MARYARYSRFICAQFCAIQHLQIDWTEPHGSRLVAKAFGGAHPASAPAGGVFKKVVRKLFGKLLADC